MHIHRTLVHQKLYVWCKSKLLSNETLALIGQECECPGKYEP